MEYRLPINKPIFAPAYIFVVDTCLTEGERCRQKGLQPPHSQLCCARRWHFVRNVAELLVILSFSLTTVSSAAPVPCTDGTAEPLVDTCALCPVRACCEPLHHYLQRS